ncbi:hypothetical protein DMUE_6413 [Dictyocoela muelleri]|nr:hypothetical protein DMUE_6413 [Dictyocoela muelleri]
MEFQSNLFPYCLFSVTQQERNTGNPNYFYCFWLAGSIINEIYDKFLSNIKETKCRTAEKCFKTHWSKENSVIEISRSNIIAERGIKLMEELSKTCKPDKYLNIKFVSKNNF